MVGDVPWTPPILPSGEAPGEEPSVTPGQAGRTTRAATRTAEARRLDRAVGPAPLRNEHVEGTP